MPASGAPSPPPSHAPACAGRRRPRRSRGSGRPARPPRAALDPIVGVARGQRASSSATSAGRLAIRSALVAKRGSSGSSGAPDRRAQALPQLLVVAADVDVPVAGAQRLVGRGQAVRRAERLRRAPVDHSSAVSQIDSASAPSHSEVSICWPSPVRSRACSAREDADGAEQAGRQVGDRDAALDRVAAGLAGDAHHARQPLRDQVEAGPLRVRAGLAEAGDRGVDQPRVDRAQRLVVGAEPRRHARPVVLDQRRRRSRRAGAALAVPAAP